MIQPLILCHQKLKVIPSSRLQALSAVGEYDRSTSKGQGLSDRG